MPLLTEGDVKALRRPADGGKEWVADGNRTGLYVRVRDTGRKTFYRRRRLDGKWDVEPLGDWPMLSLLNARRKIATGAAAGSSEAFADVAEDFAKAVIDVNYRTSGKEARAYFSRDCKTLAKRPLRRIQRADVVRVIATKAQTSPGAATKLFAMLRQFYRWCLVNGYVEADPIAELRPKDMRLPTYQPRERVLSDAELRALWAIPEEPYGRLLRFVLLTGCRIGEAQGIAREQLVGDVWTIPLTKNGKPHTIPLTATAANLAAAGWPRRDYGSLHAYLVARKTGWTPHDLRRTAATRMRDAGAPADVIEAVLNHTPPRLQRTYQRPNMLPPMRKALEGLEAAVLRIVAP